MRRPHTRQKARCEMADRHAEALRFQLAEKDAEIKALRTERDEAIRLANSDSARVLLEALRERLCPKPDDDLVRRVEYLRGVEARVRELEEAVGILARLAWRQANRERLVEMDPTGGHPEVAESQIQNGIGLICAQAAAATNTIAKAALEAAKGFL